MAASIGSDDVVVGDTQVNIAVAPRRMQSRRRSFDTGWDRIFNLDAYKMTYTQVLITPASVLRRAPRLHFCTASAYTGQWSRVNMEGFGCFRLPHRVLHEGYHWDGMFHGNGTLRYPSKAWIEGVWIRGRLYHRQYFFPDGLAFQEVDWDYCRMPDRRYYKEVLEGLRPAGRSLLTNAEPPPRPIPAKCFDTGDGFYNPRTRCVTDPHTGEVIRIPTDAEAEWIVKSCRKGSDEVVGFRPDLYENWFPREEEEEQSEEELPDMEHRYLDILQSLAAESRIPVGTETFITCSLSDQSL